LSRENYIAKFAEKTETRATETDETKKMRQMKKFAFDEVAEVPDRALL
jgi:hypothetical protein